MMRDYGGSFAVGFGAGLIVLLVVGFLWTGKGGTASPSAPEEVSVEEVSNADEQTRTATTTRASALIGAPAVGDAAVLKVHEQAAGPIVIVAEAQFASTGWLVVHEVSAGHVGNALGAARLDTGAHRDVAIELLRSTVPKSDYVLIVYADNGNRQFDIRGDLPVLDANGNPVMRSFATYEGETGTPVQE